MNTIVKEGRNLTSSELEAINYWRKIEFNSVPIMISPDDENWNKKFFLLKEDDMILAFGRLHEVNLEFMGAYYSILGFATIAAIEKNKGYGQKLVESMINFIKNDGRTGIGFCSTKNTNFYIKCGCSIINGNDRFLFKDNENKTHKSEKQGDVICFDGKDKLIEKIQSHPDEKIYIYRKHW